ncbi:zinc finger HIT domain-containing protein 2 [Eleutherodactylus coqui]|uniref:zinc finger HIT domain-containing protein 2 n=1 Tax=Eleutherodactylus coqui TaxID=57060 RepID=UPI0034618725
MQTLEADIVFPGRSSSPNPSDNGGPGPAVCALCLSAAGKYTCPRCNAPYCSLPCYKGARHSACSELFYRDSVLQALREQDGGGRREMEELLLRLREEQEGDINDEGGGLWHSLSRQEKEHFNKLVSSGHIGSLVPRWTPWWEAPAGWKIVQLPEAEQELRHVGLAPTGGHDNGTNPVGGGAPLTDVATVTGQVLTEKTDEGQMVNERNDSIEISSAKTVSLPSGNHGDHADSPQDARVDDALQGDPSKPNVSPVPPLLRSVPSLCSLTRNPSMLVRFTLVNVIYSYSFSLMRHNGDLTDDEDMVDFVGTLLGVSGALSTTTVYNSTAHALKSAVRAAADPLLGGDEGVAVLAMGATAKILLGDGGERYSLAALSHLYRLLGRIRKVVAEEKDVKKEAFNAKKKCLFLAAWVKENGERLAVLSAEVMREYKQELKDRNELAEISQGLQRAWGGKRPPAKKTLIEEVN